MSIHRRNVKTLTLTWFILSFSFYQEPQSMPEKSKNPDEYLQLKGKKDVSIT